MTKGANGLTSKKDNTKPFSSGDMEIQWFGGDRRHTYGIVVMKNYDNNDYDNWKFYATGYDDTGNCEDCSTRSFPINMSDIKNNINEIYSWTFLNNIPAGDEIQSVPLKPVQEIPLNNN